VLQIITQEKSKVLLEVKSHVNAIFIEDPDRSVINITIEPGFYLALSVIETCYIEALYGNKVVLVIYDKVSCELTNNTPN
jgi:hypothetical protein